ncbi:aldehyde dehydrogenase family protein [Ketogulonicigenium vulgare]|uniref:aldehyde dehydrogenase family protein n=1 Tax=Ketogulonicigenium vulgare TaxID=92945 RepID=UPI0002FF2F0C
MYTDTLLLIDGIWSEASDGGRIPVVNPATEEVIGHVAHATPTDLEAALAAAQRGFNQWKDVSPLERSKIMRRAADLLRARSETIAMLLTLEQGKTLGEAKGEVTAAADVIDWFAEEGRRTYGQVIPARAPGILQITIKDPVGPVAAFTPWNFPVNQVVRKLSAALSTGWVVCRAQHRLFHHRQGARRDPRLARRDDQLFC